MIDGYLKVTSDEMEQELCHVPTLLQSNMRRKVANINLKTVCKGSSEILNAVKNLYEEGYQVLTVDAVTKEDLNNIALACKSLPKNIILAGAAGFAAYLPKVMELSSNKLVKPSSKDGIILVVAGTCNPMTRKQINEVLKNTRANLIKIDTNNIINGIAHEEIINVMQKVKKHIKKEKLL